MRDEVSFPSGVSLSEKSLSELAPAKINLFLHIVGKRADGYHQVESLAVFTRYGDVLKAVPATALSLHVTGPFADGLNTDDNLVLRAARLLQTKADVKEGARLTLEKYLPVASGMGGGSADAAATLRLLAKYWPIGNPQILVECARELGADVLACLASRTLMMQGIGDELSVVDDTEPVHLLLVNPLRPVLTRDVFARFDRPFSAPLGNALPSVFACRNDLQQTATQIVPEIADILTVVEKQDGCILARMSGSGATCFGLFSNADETTRAQQIIRSAYPRWWVQATHTIPHKQGAQRGQQQ